MPAGLTHMTLSRFSLNELSSDSDAKYTLKANIGAFLMGCVGPDIPYMGQFDDWKPIAEHDHIADTLHTEHTTAIPLAGLTYARDLADKGELEAAKAVYAFYLGYISHIIADGFTHPFVRDRVGDYSKTTKNAHRTLEMKLDVLVLDHYMKVEANGVSPQQDLTFFNDCEHQDKIFESYSEFLQRFHKKSLSAEQLEKLSNGMITALNVAEVSNQFLQWYTLGAGKKGFSYMNLEDVKKEEKEVRTLKMAIDAKEKGIVYNSLGLKEIDVIDDIFPKYFSYMPKVIEAAYDYVFNNGPEVTSFVPEINLDNGRLLANQDLKNQPALWTIA